MKLSKRLLAAAATTVILGTLVSGASARNLSVSNQSMRMAWAIVTLSGGFGETNCALTLESTVHSRTMVKFIGSLVGYITSAILGRCTSGTATVLRETLPWHIRYSGFGGMLPIITSLYAHVTNFAIRVRELFGVTCLLRSTTTEPVIETLHRATATGAISEATLGGTIASGEECFHTTGTFSSISGEVSLLGTIATRITVLLI
jgi:hypothetical protein